MWELDHKEGWVLKNWWFWTVVLEKTLENPLDCKEIKPVHPKGDQPWIFIGRTDADAEAPILWPPDGNSRLTGKDPNAGKDWRQKSRGWQRMRWLEWHHQFNGHELGQTLGDSEGQGGRMCCSPWDCKESRDDLATKQQHWFIFGCAGSSLLRGLFSSFGEWGLLSSRDPWSS